MSVAERAYKARSEQGKLSPEQLKQLRDDCLLLLDGAKHEKSLKQIASELVKFCGWKRAKIYGPRPFLRNVLEALERDGLAESRDECTDDFEVHSFFWKKSNVPMELNTPSQVQ